MLTKLFHYMRIAKNFPLVLLFTRIMLKIGIKNHFIKKLDFLNSPDTKRPTKSIEILLNHMKTAGLSINQLFKKIPNAVILEVGCGKHLGLGMTSLNLGAKKFIGIDPYLDKKIIFDHEIIEKYFRISIKKNIEYFQKIQGFKKIKYYDDDSKVNELLSRCVIEQRGISNSMNFENIDICTSISCLEHILDFKTSCKVLSKISNENTLHIHVVNFSNHLSKEKPFHHLYEMSLSDFKKQWANNINGLRVNDMVKLFHEVGLKLRAIPLDVNENLVPKNMHQSWINNYDIKDLSVRTALITSL